jgi:hypothetical protein
VEGRGASSPYLPVPRRQRCRYTFSIQRLGDGRLTIATDVHLEDAPDDRRLFFDDFELHTADRKSSNIPPCNGRRLAGKMNPANSP